NGYSLQSDARNLRPRRSLRRHLARRWHPRRNPRQLIETSGTSRTIQEPVDLVNMGGAKLGGVDTGRNEAIAPRTPAGHVLCPPGFPESLGGWTRRGLQSGRILPFLSAYRAEADKPLSAQPPAYGRTLRCRSY